MNKFNSKIDIIETGEIFFFIELNNMHYNIKDFIHIRDNILRTSKYAKHKIRGKRETFRRVLIKYNIRYISKKEKENFYKLLNYQEEFNYFLTDIDKEKEYRKQENKKIVDKLNNF